MHVDLNNVFYSEAYSQFVIDHLSKMADGKCCPHYSCCRPCHMIKDMLKVGTLKTIIMFQIYYNYYEVEWWDYDKQEIKEDWIFSHWGVCPKTVMAVG